MRGAPVLATEGILGRVEVFESAASEEPASGVLDGPALAVAKEAQYRGTSLIRNHPPPDDRHRSLGMVLL